MAHPEKDGKDLIPEYNDQEVMARLDALQSQVVTPRYEDAVKGYIKTYVVRHRRNAEVILGRSAIYFPLFEKHLRERGMPSELKYLAIVESALNPRIVSRAGARGLWQFMPYTGKEYGLRVDNEIDERCDPQKSTAAAVRFLSDLHGRFGDWALALAAYNAGPGRVNGAIKRARSHDYWKVRRFLPRETANYVPAFIAASYLVEYYKLHNLKPEWPSLDLQITEAVEIHNHLSFFRVAQLTGLTLEVIRQLNPAFRGDYIPENASGHFLNLPKRVVPRFRELYENPELSPELETIILSNPVQVSTPDFSDELTYEEIVITACQDDNMAELAEFLDCDVYQLQIWNHDLLGQPNDWQELVAYRPKSEIPVAHARPIRKAQVTPLPKRRLPRTLQSLSPQAPESYPLGLKPTLTYTSSKRERLTDVCSRFPGMDVQEVAEHNGLPVRAVLKPGTSIVLPTE